MRYDKKNKTSEVEIRNKAIDDFAEQLRLRCIKDTYHDVHLSEVFEIAKELKGE